MTRTGLPINVLSAGVYQALGYCFEIHLQGEPALEMEGTIRQVFQGLDAGRAKARRHLVKHRYVVAGFEAEAGPLVRIDRDGERIGTDTTARQGLIVLMADVNLQAVASRSDTLVVHAGAVSVGGLGILLPGCSGAGKSTLTAALVSAGCDYLTDEAVSIDVQRLEMEPYAKPLSLSPKSIRAVGLPLGEHGTAGLVPASLLRPESWGLPVPPGLLIFPQFQFDSPTALSAISRGEALVELANNSFNFVERGSELLPGLGRLVLACSCWRLTAGHAKEAARRIMDTVGSVRKGYERSLH